MLELNKKNFETEVLQAAGKVLVDFYGDGCAPCAALTPHIRAFEETYGDRIKFCALKASRDRQLAVSQRVLGLPVIAIYEKGQMTDSLMMAAATPEAVEEMIKKHI